ncbi:MAG: T9SS type A sorting domain-containing protein [Bacteroidota bacterium]|nr:T9SS type A sorting domain-containing protein [Bacteroidota bacterium]
MIDYNKHITFLYFLSNFLFLSFSNSYSQNITWNGSQSNEWNNTSNWTPNTIPNSSSHYVIIDDPSVSFHCILDTNRVIGSLNISDGKIDLNGFILTLNLEFVSEGGIIKNGQLISREISNIENTKFEDEITIIKTFSTSGVNDLAGGNVFYGHTTFINEDNNRLRLASINGDTFKNNVSFIKRNTGNIEVARSGNNYFDGDINCIGTILFGQNDGFVIINGKDSQNIYWDSVGVKPSFPRLKMNTTQNGELTLNTPIDITDSLILIEGVINTNNVNILRLTDETTYASIGNIRSFINGPMDYILSNNALNGYTLNFPIGKKLLPKNYYPEYYVWRPVSLLVGHTVSTSYTYRAEMFNLYNSNLGWTLPSGVDTASRARTWDIQRFLSSTMVSEPSNNLRTNLTSGQRPIVTLYFGYNDSVFDGNNLTILKNTTTNPNDWINIGGTGAPNFNNRNPLQGSITSTSVNFNSFSTFTLGSLANGYNPLSFKLLSFNAEIQDNTVVISWASTDDIDLSYYQLEKSTDGILWSVIDEIEVSSTQLGIKHYKTIDNIINHSAIYYRLKMIHRNATFDFSYIISPHIKSIQTHQISILPNPIKQFFIISSNTYTKSVLKWHIVNSYGKILLYGETEPNESIDVSSLSNGLYYLQVISKNHNENIKLIINR